MQATAVRHRGEFGGIATMADLDQAIKIIGLCDVRLAQIEQEMHLEVTRLKNEALVKAAEAQAEREKLLGLCQTFVVGNRDQVLGDRKTATLNFGKIGYRKEPAKVPLPKKTSDEMEDLCRRIDVLREDGTSFAEVKFHVQRYVLTGDVKHLTDEELAEIELRRIPGSDVFFVEPDRAKLEEVASE